MTDRQPMTEEICMTVGDSMVDFKHGFPDAHDHMRAGADWQLEQVLKWLNEAIYERSLHEAEDLPEELAEAMRPTTTPKNN